MVAGGGAVIVQMADDGALQDAIAAGDRDSALACIGLLLPDDDRRTVARSHEDEPDTETMTVQSALVYFAEMQDGAMEQLVRALDRWMLDDEVSQMAIQAVVHIGLALANDGWLSIHADTLSHMFHTVRRAFSLHARLHELPLERRRSMAKRCFAMMEEFLHRIDPDTLQLCQLGIYPRDAEEYAPADMRGVMTHYLCEINGMAIIGATTFAADEFTLRCSIEILEHSMRAFEYGWLLPGPAQRLKAAQVQLAAAMMGGRDVFFTPPE